MTDHHVEALQAIAGPSNSGPWVVVYHEAGGGYEGLQAIARAALAVDPVKDDGAAYAALEEIKRDCGLVCENFMECTHRSCNSSYTAWVIADEALSERSPKHEPEREWQAVWINDHGLRTELPCVDENDAKAIVEIRLTHPRYPAERARGKNNYHGPRSAIDAQTHPSSPSSSTTVYVGMLAPLGALVDRRRGLR